jgi:hypothetical protein
LTRQPADRVWEHFVPSACLARPIPPTHPSPPHPQRYASDIINRTELLNLAGDIIGRFPDLMAGFKQFLVRIETFDGFEQVRGGGAARGREEWRGRAGAETRRLPRR